MHLLPCSAPSVSWTNITISWLIEWVLLKVSHISNDFSVHHNYIAITKLLVILLSWNKMPAKCDVWLPIFYWGLNFICCGCRIQANRSLITICLRPSVVLSGLLLKMPRSILDMKEHNRKSGSSIDFTLPYLVLLSEGPFFWGPYPWVVPLSGGC